MWGDLYACHCEESVHAGQTKCWGKLTAKFGRSIPRQIMCLFMANCWLCVTAPTRANKPKAGSRPIIETDFMERMQLDLVDMHHFNATIQTAEAVSTTGTNAALMSGTPLHGKSNYKYLLSILDCGSKLSEYYALESKRPAAVAWCLWQWCCRYGVPKILHTDNGACIAVPAPVSVYCTLYTV